MSQLILWGKYIPNFTHHRKRKLESNIPNEYKWANPQESINKLNLASMWMVLYAMIKWDLFQECKVGSTYENKPGIQHINKGKKNTW